MNLFACGVNEVTLGNCVGPVDYFSSKPVYRYFDRHCSRPARHSHLDGDNVFSTFEERTRALYHILSLYGTFQRSTISEVASLDPDFTTVAWQLALESHGRALPDVLENGEEQSPSLIQLSQMILSGAAQRWRTYPVFLVRGLISPKLNKDTTNPYVPLESR